MEIDSETKDYIQQKFDMLDKYLGSIPAISCKVEIGLNSSHHNKGKIYFTKAHLELKNELIIIEKASEKLVKSIDKTKDHLVQSITKYKGKL